jgi:phosphatidylglycerophosphatase A
MRMDQTILLVTTALLLILGRVLHRAALRHRATAMHSSSAWGLWLAQGFGVGLIPIAPGTFGSIVGVICWAALLLGRNWFLFSAGLLLLMVLSVCLTGRAEEWLGAKDPGSIVLDEIAAIPLCYLAWMIVAARGSGRFPDINYFFSRQTWPITMAVLAFFRVFDIWKPWPVRQSQLLPGGWGVTADDLLAAGYVNALVLLAWISGLRL